MWYIFEKDLTGGWLKKKRVFEVMNFKEKYKRDDERGWDLDQEIVAIWKGAWWISFISTTFLSFWPIQQTKKKKEFLNFMRLWYALYQIGPKDKSGLIVFCNDLNTEESGDEWMCT